MPARHAALGALRGLLLIILLLGIVGTGIELLLLEHTEGVWQLVPLLLLGVALLVLTWHLIARSPASVRVTQLLMLTFILSGFAGLLLHYRGNVEFERELHTAAAGFELFWEAIKGATPTLAPGAMIQLGLIGLVYTHRHPALTAGSPDSASPSREQ
ncbi:MAG TPA: hypothetical protein VGQ69_11815 [Gemmatimonadales bacterium]|jgi:hypothetical protein|nr:hypothetical protein [Gemmatimonadales bacterium]